MSRVLDLWRGMTGTVLDFAGTAAPTGWLLCFGQSLLRTDYPALFAAIGTTYGAADGTHFNVPDCRGRVAAGKDDMGGAAAARLTSAASGVDGVTLGNAGGAQAHTLSEAQIPAHSHDVYGSNGSASNADTRGLHRNDVVSVAGFHQGTPTPRRTLAGATSQNILGNTGSSEAHPNVQPTMVLNKIIKI